MKTHSAQSFTSTVANTIINLFSTQKEERDNDKDGKAEEKRKNSICRRWSWAWTPYECHQPQPSSAKGKPAVKQEAASTIQPPPWRKTEHRSKEEALRGDRGGGEELNGQQEGDVEAAGEKSSHKSCKKTDESDFHRLLFIRSSQFRYNWLPVMIYNSHQKRVEPMATRTTELVVLEEHQPPSQWSQWTDVSFRPCWIVLN